MKIKDLEEKQNELQQGEVLETVSEADAPVENALDENNESHKRPSKPSGDVVEVTKILDDDLTDSAIEEPLSAEKPESRGFFGRRRHKSRPSGDVIEVTKLEESDLFAEEDVATPEENKIASETEENTVIDNNETVAEKPVSTEEEAKAKAKEEVAKIVAKINAAKAAAVISQEVHSETADTADLNNIETADSGTVNEVTAETIYASETVSTAEVFEEAAPELIPEEQTPKVSKREQWRQRHQRRRRPETAEQAEKIEVAEQAAPIEPIVYSESVERVSYSGTAEHADIIEPIIYAGDVEHIAQDEAAERIAYDEALEHTVQNETDEPRERQAEPEPEKLPKRRKRKEKRPKKKLKPLTIILIIIGAVIVAVYIAGIAVGHFMFYPNTYINDVNVSWMNAEDSNYILLPHNEYFTVVGRTGEENIKLSDFDYKITLIHKTKDLIYDQDMWAWPAYFFKDTVIDDACKNTYNLQSLRELISQLPSFQQENMDKPTNAYIDVDKDGNHYIVEQTEGTQLDTSKASRTIVNAVNGGLFTVNLDEKDCYVHPTIYSDDPDMNKTLSTYKALGEETITIDVTGTTEVLKPEDLLNFVTLGDDNKTITIKEDVLTKYVTDLAAKYDTWNKQREFTTSTGSKIYVGGSGVDNYGFLMDQNSTINTLRSAILEKKTQTITPTWTHKGWSRGVKNGDIGVTYIEISIASQTMWFYRDNKLVLSTPVVTGLPDGGRNTPCGVFNAWSMSTNTRLTGTYGSDSWDCVVNYWVSVDNNGVGIHDATWQPYFGGDRYIYGGSHGCINTPLDAMGTLYNNLQQGTPIVIY